MLYCVLIGVALAGLGGPAKAGANEKNAQENSTGVKVAPGASETDRLLAGLDQIRKLKGSFAKEDGESVGGAMSAELAHGSDIWGAIDSLVMAASATKGGDKKST